MYKKPPADYRFAHQLHSVLDVPFIKYKIVLGSAYAKVSFLGYNKAVM